MELSQHRKRKSLKKGEKYEEQSSDLGSEQADGCCTEDSSAQGLLGRKKETVEKKCLRHIWKATKCQNETTIWRKQLRIIFRTTTQLISSPSH